MATPYDALLNVEKDSENNENDPIVSDLYMEIPITQKRGLQRTIDWFTDNQRLGQYKVGIYNV